MKEAIGSFIGGQPVVHVTERMLISQIPEAEREAFAHHLSPVADRTRSGEIVFDTEIYRRWKSRKQ